METIKKLWHVWTPQLLFMMVGVIIIMIMLFFLFYDPNPADNTIHTIITVVSVDRKVFGSNIWDSGNIGAFVVNTKEEITMPDGRTYRQFVVLDGGIITMNTIFRNLYNFPSYWGNFQAMVTLHVNPKLGMPVLDGVDRFINPRPPD